MTKLDIKHFIEESSKIHNNFYDYSKVNYINSHTRVEIICPKHGLFLQLPYVHLQNHGCPKCADNLSSNKLSCGTVGFIKKCKLIYGKTYDYSKVNYKNSHTKVEIICKLHGSFYQTPLNHLNFHGCPKCGIIKTSKKTSKGTKKFILEANIVHNNYYDYSQVKYKNAIQLVKIICPKHGYFYQRPHDHLASAAGCPKCSSSKGELSIEKWLTNNDIKYEFHKTFDDCRNPRTNRKLEFDFYIPHKNLLIEYDGMQHFTSDCYVGRYKTNKKDLKNIIYRDNIKNNYALQKQIKLLRIKYDQSNNIDGILKQNVL